VLTVHTTRPDRLVAQGAKGAKGAKGQDSLYQVDWAPLPAPRTTPTSAPATTVADASELAGIEPAGTVFAYCPPGPRAKPAGPSDGELPERVSEVLIWALELAQAWLADDRFTDSQLTFVTEAATGERPGDLAHAAVWGLIRSAQTENPGRFALVDLDGTDKSTDKSTHALTAAAASAAGEPQVAVRGGGLYAPRLVRAEAAPDVTDQAPLAGTDGTVLVSGATGELGGLIARHLVTAYGVRRLLLVSRRGPNAPGATELREELTALGAHVTVAACDLADPQAAAELLAAHTVTGIVHAAGVLDDTTIPGLTPERLHTVLRAKVDAAWNLHQLAGDAGLFALFSSVSGTIGGAGQGNYAAANAFLDALAAHRRSQGLAGLSLAWGLWEQQQGGMTEQLSQADLARMARIGILPIEPVLGLELFDAGLRSERPVLVPVRLDLSALRDPAPLLRGLVRTPLRRTASATARAGAGAPGDGTAGPALADRLAGLSREDRARVLHELVLGQVADVLGHTTPDSLDAERGLLDQGIDSLTAVELRNRLGSAVGHPLPSTLIFDHPTVVALAGYLDSEVLPAPISGLAELNRLEELLLSLPTEDNQRGLLAQRLQDVLAKAGIVLPADPGTTGQLLETASDDELFDFIDNELGN
jgi:pimaricinolide synthase PimS1